MRRELKWIKLSFRNVLRNSRRSLMGIIMVAFATVSICISYGFISASFSGLKESVIQSGLGHIQITKKNIVAGTALSEDSLLNENDITKISQVLNNISSFDFSIEQINLEGLVSNGINTKAVLINATDLEKEQLLAKTLSNIVEGYIEDIEDKPNQAVLGIILANSLNVKVGENVTILSNTLDGSINAIDVDVVALSKTGIPQLDERSMLINYKSGVDLINVGSVASKVIVVLDDTNNVSDVVSKLNSELNGEYEILSWKDLAFYYNQVVSLYNSIFIFFSIIIMSLVLIAVVNIVTMSVVERTVEIGTMQSFGITNLRITLNFMTESFIIGLIGVALGLSLSLLLSNLINVSQIMMPAPPGRIIGYPLLISINHVFYSIVGIAMPLLCMIISLIPTRQIFKLKVVDAIRYS